MIDPDATTVLANPAAAGGRVGRTWARITTDLAEILGPVEFQLTERSGHARELARASVERGRATVLSLGGDGTHSEVAAGLFDAGGPPGSACLGILPAGTGGDFKRLVEGSGDLLEHARLLREAVPQPIDLARARFTGDDGAARERPFLNLASIGMGALVCTLVNRSSKRLGGKATFLLATLRALATYRPLTVRVVVDDQDHGAHTISTIAVANGQYAGGGMHFAPGARLGDGQLEVTVIRHTAAHRAVPLLPRLYDGRIAESALVSTFSGRTIRLEPVGDAPVGLELDGEPLGRLAAEIAVIPGAISLLGAREGVV